MKAPVAAATVLLALASGCGVVDRSDGYRVTVEFSDVLDLVPHSSVKVDDVTVGSVEKISLSGWTAKVRVRLDRKVQLPANATAAVRQTSLLGEKYVEVAKPTTEAARGKLTDGSVIPLARTRRSAEVEEVLAALGLVLNGGGLAQLKTINQELATAFDGREPVARDALHQLDEFMGGLDKQKADLVRAIEALDRLTGRLVQQRAVIGDALDALGPGITVLADQSTQLTGALKSLGELGTVGTRVVNESKADTVASLRALRPILDQLVKAGDDLPQSLDFLLTYPFPPNVTGAIVGDFVNLAITADLDAASILANLVAAGPRVSKAGKTATTTPRGTTKTPKPGTLAPSLPGQLPLECLPLDGILPPEWVPPKECKLPDGCKLLAPGSPVPLGGLLIPAEGLVPAGTVFPAGTKLPKGTVLTAQCLLGAVTGAVDGVVGGLTDVLTGGLTP